MTSWFSILPENLTIYEVWLARFFLLLGVLTVLPWIVLIIYDAFLYLFRTVTYDIPVIGGRARGRARPRGLSLSARPSGQRRTFSISGAAGSGVDGASASGSGGGDGVLRPGGEDVEVLKRRREAAIADTQAVE